MFFEPSFGAAVTGVFLCKSKTHYPKVQLRLRCSTAVLELLLWDWFIAESNFTSTDAAQCLVRSPLISYQCLFPCDPAAYLCQFALKAVPIFAFKVSSSGCIPDATE
jgi:hypothetical protein